jgi:glycosyltransferase involved in cell wall biosynthesis
LYNSEIKKIVVLSLHPEFGGGASANANIIEMLSQKNEVFFIDEYLESTQKCLKDKPENLGMIYFPIGKYKFCPWKIRKLIQKINPDYIIVGFPFLLIFYWPILMYFRLLGSKIIVIFHSLSLGENFKSKFLDILVSTSALVSNRLVFVSDFTSKSWNKSPVIKIVKQQSTIFNAVNQPNFLNPNKVIKTIGFIGRLSKEKQPELFCQLAAQAYSEGLPYQFILWGDGPLSINLTSKYSQCVQFKGVSYDLNELYANVDLLILTSKFENCPMVVLESKIRGIPSICPRVGGIPEIIVHGKDGRLLDNLDLKTILAEISIINKDYGFYSRNCIQNSKDFSIASITHKWNEIIN